MKAFAQNKFLLLSAGGLLALTVLLSGCQWVGFTNHVTPEVRGRVVDAASRQPLAGVLVARGARGGAASAAEVPHGAALLMAERPVRTDADGTFVYPSASYMTLLRGASWWSLRLAFQQPGYALVRTNFSTADVTTNLPSGTPVVNAGDIALRKLPQ